MVRMLVNGEAGTLKSVGLKERFKAVGAARWPYTHRPATVGVVQSLTVHNLDPVQIFQAYQLPVIPTLPDFSNLQLPTIKLGVVSLGGSVNESDNQAAFTKWQLPKCNLKVIFAPGGGQRPDQGGANVENALDYQIQGATYAHLTKSAATILTCFAPNSGHGIADAIRTLVDNGCLVISISWGAPESGWTGSDRAYTETALAYARSKSVWVTAASGDNSVNDGTTTPTVDYPCGSGLVLSCGGTRLELAAGGGRINESAWGDGNPGDPGGGGGFDPNTPMPAYQSKYGRITGHFRGAPDVAANADPESGWGILSDGQWQSVGGTSAAAPFWAGFLAAVRSALLARELPVPADPMTVLYANPSSLYDVVRGSNGQPATNGWDEATGLGTPTASTLAAFLGTGTVSPPPPPPPPNPTTIARWTVHRTIKQGTQVQLPVFTTPIDMIPGPYALIKSLGMSLADITMEPVSEDYGNELV